MTRNGIEVVLANARKVWESNPQILKPIEDTFDVKLSDRLYNEKYLEGLYLCLSSVSQAQQAEWATQSFTKQSPKVTRSVGAIEAPNCPAVGKTLRGTRRLPTPTLKLLSSEQIQRSPCKTQTFSYRFTAPAADLVNIPIVARHGQTHNLGHHRLHTRTKPTGNSGNDGQSSRRVLTQLQCRRQHTLQTRRSNSKRSQQATISA